MGKVIAIILAGLMLGGCPAGGTAGAVNLINAMRTDNATLCSQVVVAYTPFSNSFCVCRSNAPAGSSTITVGTTQCSVSTQPPKTATP